MKYLLLALIILNASLAQASLDSSGQDSTIANETVEKINTGPSIEEINSSPNPTPNGESENFSGTLSTGEAIPTGPYDKNGQFQYKESESREAEEADEGPVKEP